MKNKQEWFLQYLWFTTDLNGMKSCFFSSLHPRSHLKEAGQICEIYSHKHRCSVWFHYWYMQLTQCCDRKTAHDIDSLYCNSVFCLFMRKVSGYLTSLIPLCRMLMTNVFQKKNCPTFVEQSCFTVVNHKSQFILIDTHLHPAVLHARPTALSLCD